MGSHWKFESLIKSQYVDAPPSRKKSYIIKQEIVNRENASKQRNSTIVRTATISLSVTFSAGCTKYQ